MAAVEKPKKEYDYGNVHISLENCILPEERLSETPSIKDGLEKATETDLRILGCEFIQTSGILLKLPQVAMATGQILLQRFYYSKSLVKHDVEIYAMACIFLAAKIEESPRRLRDVINVFHHIKQKRSKRTVTPMDYFSNAYFAMKNNVIKAERRVLKVIITYLQILEHEKNAALAQKAWNYMNDSLRTDVFLRFPPETIGCACIFLAARSLKISLPQRPPWWELFDSTYDDVEEISLTLLKLYARPKVRMNKLDEAIENAKKLLQDKKDVAKENGGDGTPGSFTPAHTSPNIASNNNLPTKPSSKTASPAKASPSDKTTDQGKTRNNPSDSKRSNKKHAKDEKYSRKSSNSPRRKNVTKDESFSSNDSESESPSPERKRKYKKETRPRSHSSGESDDDRHRKRSKDRRNESDSRPRSRLDKENGYRGYNYDKRYQDRSKSRSRSRSRDRRDKIKEKRREKGRDERYSDRDYRNTYDRYDYKKGRR
eukprot:gene7125-12779_t